MTADPFRLGYAACRDHLLARLSEPAPARIQLLTGPRQVGKTTLLLEIAGRLGERAIYGAGDGPEAALPGYWERLFRDAEDKVQNRSSAVLLLDEIQHFPRWAARLKAEWDRLRRKGTPVHVIATGSSSLRLGVGARESMAGRFERLTLAHWTARALVEELAVDPDRAPEFLVSLGSYPGALALRDDPDRCRAYIREAIAEPALSRDLLSLGLVRRPALMREVFLLCTRVPAQIVSLQKLQGQLQDAGALETVAHYLHLLEEAYLVAGVAKHTDGGARMRASPPKIVVLNNALMAAMDPRGVPDPEAEPDRFGMWVENAVLAHGWNCGQRVGYWREEPCEVDAVFDGSWGTWAVEVKTRPFDSASLRGLLEFCRRHPRYRPLVLTGEGGDSAAGRAGAASMPWKRFLMEGPIDARR